MALAIERIAALPDERRLFLFVNISAIHQPNRLFLPGANGDTMASMAAALAYVDRHVPRLFDVLTMRAPLLAVVCADHGTAYGEDGFHGHRIAHPVVWDVPYAEFVRAKGATVAGGDVRS